MRAELGDAGITHVVNCTRPNYPFPTREQLPTLKDNFRVPVADDIDNGTEW